MPAICFRFTRLSLVLLLLLYSTAVQAQRKRPAAPVPAVTFRSAFPATERVFLGPDYWANPLQDWHVRNGRIECRISSLDRNVHLLTGDLAAGAGTLDMQVVLGFLQHDTVRARHNWIGFRIGALGPFDDYRSHAVFGRGLDLGITAHGELFIGSPRETQAWVRLDLHLPLDLRLHLEQTADRCCLRLSAYDHASGRLLDEVADTVNRPLAGNLALVSHFEGIISRASQPSAWFQDWQIGGSKFTPHPDRSYGPVLFTQYTLSRGLLKLVAQLAPLGSDDGQVARLEVRRGEDWELLAEACIDPDARTATFRVPGWTAQAPVACRVTCELLEAAGQQTHAWQDIIRPEPDPLGKLVVAAFTGNNDLGFPNNDLTTNVARHDPDLLFFSGDQIYEGVGGYGYQTEPVEMAMLDYLRKWYLFGWTYRDLMRDRPSVCIPDDHDVYHGNIWGAGGKATPATGDNFERQDAGGYKMLPRFVRMVERTQCSHLPDPYDPTPVAQGIGVYYTELVYGGVSFAIIEDRKFKDAPKALLPEAQVNNGWPQNPAFDMRTRSDVPTASLLGARQEAFLAHWVQDGSQGAYMKVLLSQTIFANVATLPAGELHDRVVPQLRILPAGAYPPDDMPVSDMDANGWPQTARNRALRILQRGQVLHIAGDQHLGSTIQYGIDTWRDGGIAFCVPAVSNVWPRRWFPQVGGQNRAAEAPAYTGDFEDGFGNKMTVFAVSNPVFTGREPSQLYDRATGYGVVRLDNRTREVVIECWPRDSDPRTGAQYPGWPLRFGQQDNDGRRGDYLLPELLCDVEEVVVQVFAEPLGEHVYTHRIGGTRYVPRVFAPGIYTLRCSDLATGRHTLLQAVEATTVPGRQLPVVLRP
ncbi:MAG: hypothetical protein OHK0039_31390 [Bacteroidia bacterium]